MTTQETIILHGPFRQRIRHGKTTSKARITLEVKTKPLYHHFDEFSLGKGPATVLRDILSKAITDYSGTVAPATVVAREKAARAYDRGRSWAVKRYAGKRRKDGEMDKRSMGDTPPKMSRLRDKRNFSGRLAQGLFVRENKTEKSFTVNFPASRFSSDTFYFSELQQATEQLGRDIPVFGNPRLAFQEPAMQAAVRDSIHELIADATSRNRALKRRLRQEILALGGRLGRAAWSLGA